MYASELVEHLAVRLNRPRKQIRAVLDELGATVVARVRNGEEVVLPGLGKFVRLEKPSRNGYSAIAGEPMIIPARNVPKFKPSAALRRKLPQPRSAA